MCPLELRVPLREAGWVDADEDHELLERAGHDREAFALLYRRHRRLLLDHVYRRTGDVHTTEDLVSDVFLTALRTLPRYRYRGVPVRFWLLRIATNAVNRWARRQRRWSVRIVSAEHIETVPAEPPPEGGEVDPEYARRALLALPPKYQSVLALHHMDGLAVTEVAAILGCRVGTVKSRLSRARHALRAALTKRS